MKLTLDHMRPASSVNCCARREHSCAYHQGVIDEATYLADEITEDPTDTMGTCCMSEPEEHDYTSADMCEYHLGVWEAALWSGAICGFTPEWLFGPGRFEGVE